MGATLTTRAVVRLRFAQGFAWSERGEAFYVTGTVLPQAGTWRIEVSAGLDRGCFDLHVRRSD